MTLLHPTDPGYKAHVRTEFERILARPHDFIDIVLQSANFADAKTRVQAEFDVEPEIAVLILHQPIMHLSNEGLDRLSGDDVAEPPDD